jgi:hypothetical protein
MALASTLNELAGTGPARQNRVATLLDKLKEDKSDDYTILLDALGNRHVTAATLTRALRKEYGHDIVKDSSVTEYRRSHSSEINGL